MKEIKEEIEEKNMKREEERFHSITVAYSNAIFTLILSNLFHLKRKLSSAKSGFEPVLM